MKVPPMQVSSGSGWVEARPGTARLDKRWLSNGPAMVEALLSDDPHDVLIDLHGVTMVDSAVPVLLSQLADACTKRGGHLFIARSPLLLVNMLKGTGVRGLRFVGDPSSDADWLAAKMGASGWKKSQ